MKKYKLDLSRETVQRIVQKLKFDFIFIFMFREIDLKVTFKQKNIHCFKVGSFGKDTDIFNLLLAAEDKGINPITLL